MSTTAADVLVDCLVAWDVEIVFGLPGDGINGIIEALRTAPGQDPLHPGAARGGGGLHGLRLCQVHRQARRLPRHLRAGRHPPAQRPLRRQARRRAGAGDHRPAVPRPDRTPTPSRTSSSTSCSWTSASTTRASWGRRMCENVMELACRTALACRGVAHVTMPVDMQSMPLEVRRALGAQRAASRLRWLAADGMPVAGRGRAAARGRHPERRQEDLHPGRPRRARRRRRAGGASPSSSARRSSRRCSARAPCRTTARYCTGGIGLLGTEPSQEALEDCDTLLIVGSTFPYIEFYPKPGQARARADRPRRRAHRAALSGRSAAWSAMPPARCGRCCRARSAAAGPRLPRQASQAEVGSGAR